MHHAAPHGIIAGHALWLWTAGSTAETSLSSTQSGGAAVRRVRGRHTAAELQRLAVLEKTLDWRRACCLHFHHFWGNHWQYAKLITYNFYLLIYCTFKHLTLLWRIIIGVFQKLFPIPFKNQISCLEAFRANIINRRVSSLTYLWRYPDISTYKWKGNRYVVKFWNNSAPLKWKWFYLISHSKLFTIHVNIHSCKCLNTIGRGFQVLTSSWGIMQNCISLFIL